MKVTVILGILCIAAVGVFESGKIMFRVSVI